MRRGPCLTPQRDFQGCAELVQCGVGKLVSVKVVAKRGRAHDRLSAKCTAGPGGCWTRCGGDSACCKLSWKRASIVDGSAMCPPITLTCVPGVCNSLASRRCDEIMSYWIKDLNLGTAFECISVAACKGSPHHTSTVVVSAMLPLSNGTRVPGA